MEKGCEPAAAPGASAGGLVRWSRRLWGFTLCAAAVSWAIHAVAPLAQLWLTEDTAQIGQLSVFNSIPGGGEHGMPVEIGDLNGDAFPDLVLAPMAATTALGERDRGGEIYIYPGNGRIEGIIDRAALGDTPPGVTIWGAERGDFLGTEVYIADVNGDGLKDLLFTAQNYNGPPGGQRELGGGAFILPGRPDLFAESRRIDMADPPPEIVTIQGPRPGDRLGIWIEAGDLDGDGRDDILVGADMYTVDPFSPEFHRGSAYVIYGRAVYPRIIDLAQAASLDGVTTLLGRRKDDHFGCTIHARDLNRDGREDLIVSAALNRESASVAPYRTITPHATGGGDGPEGNRLGCGEVNVIFPPPGRLPPLIDLAQPLPAALEGRVTVIHGATLSESAGEELTTGDFNGDGFPDLVVGGLTGANPSGIITGVAYVLYWREGLEGRTVDLLRDVQVPNPDGPRISKLYSLRLFDLLGDTLSVGDFDRDGRDDLAVGIPMYTYIDDDRAVEQVGQVAVAYGQPDFWPLLWAPQAEAMPAGIRVAYVLGPGNREDLLSYSMEAADYDLDGYTDLFPNAMRGDGRDNRAPSAGEAYLVSGYRLSGAALGVSRVEPAAGFSFRATPVIIEGQGFTTTADTRLFIDGAAAVGFEVQSGQRIAFLMPRRDEPGPVEVRVENRYGSSALPDAFTYLQVRTFLRGDSNTDLRLSITDPIHTLYTLFLGGAFACDDASDSDDDGQVAITDAIRTLGYLYLGGPPPAPPFPAPGIDETPDGLAGCP